MTNFRIGLYPEYSVYPCSIKVEPRVEVDQVDAFVREIIAQDGQIIPIVKGVFGDWFGVRTS
jgi:hypothetical protein